MFSALVDDAAIWRRRVIHRLEFRSAEHVRITTEYQCELPASQLLKDAASPPESARLLLPLATRDKSPLLDFDLDGPVGAPHLLPRGELAVLQARYLRRLLERSGLTPVVQAAFPEDLLVAISVFSPDVFRAFVEKRRTRKAALRDFLTGGLDLHVEDADIDAWLETTLEATYDLWSFIGEPPDRAFTDDSEEFPFFSSSECVLLALPSLATKPTAVAQVGALVASYAAGIVELQRRSGAGDIYATAFLTTLTEYGRRWLMVLDAEVPLDVPGTFKTSDDRPLRLTRSMLTRHQLAFKEGASVHVEARSLDPAVRLDLEFEVLDPFGARVGIGPVRDSGGEIGPLELAQSTAEVVSLYSSTPERPERVELSVRLLPVADVRWPPLVALVLTLGASVLAALLPNGRDLVNGLAVLAVPTTFAATFALIREQTTLATRLLRTSNVLLGTGIAVLWVIVGVRLIS